MLKGIRNYSFLLWFGAALLLVSGFIEITGEYMDAEELAVIDSMVQRKITEWRSPVWSYIFLNITTLGSSVLVILHSGIGLALLLTTNDRIGALQLGMASAGAYILTELTKDFIERPRPTGLEALVDAFGYSYPSGHALSAAAMYMTLALLACRHLRQFRQRVLLGILAGFVISSVAFSRVYLGVHFFSDVVSGLLLGTAWALLLAGVFAAVEFKNRRS